jgi:hypothetical protein
VLDQLIEDKSIDDVVVDDDDVDDDVDTHTSPCDTVINN